MRYYTYLLLFLTSSIEADAQSWRLIEYKKQEYKSFDSTQYSTKDSVRYIYDYVNGRGGLPGYVVTFYDTIKYTEKKVYSMYAPSTTLDFIEEWKAHFLPDDNIYIQQCFAPGSTTPSRVDSFKYVNGKIDEILLSRWDAQWDWFAYEKRNFGHDSLNNISVASISYRLAAPMSWMGSDNYHYHYDSVNRLVSYEYITHAHINYYVWQHEYIYDTAGRLAQTNFGYYKNGKEYDTSYYTRYYYDSTGLQVVDSLFDHPANTYSARYIHKYNQDGLLIQTDYYNGDIKNYTEYYVYEIYWPKGISHTENNSINIDLFPNPATYTLNVSVNARDSKKINLSIVNVQGVLYRNWSDKVTGSLYQKQIAVADLPPGIYMLTVDDGNTREARQFVIK